MPLPWATVLTVEEASAPGPPPRLTQPTSVNISVDGQASGVLRIPSKPIHQSVHGCAVGSLAQIAAEFVNKHSAKHGPASKPEVLVAATCHTWRPTTAGARLEEFWGGTWRCDAGAQANLVSSSQLWEADASPFATLLWTTRLPRG